MAVEASDATDVAGVAKEWDSYEDIRERLRGPGKEKEKDEKKESTILAPGPACQDISTSVKQKSFLEPLLSKMALTVKRPVPGIDQLKDEIQSLLQMNKRGTDFDWDDVAKAGWCLRKLCGFVKAKCRRREDEVDKVNAKVKQRLQKKGRKATVAEDEDAWDESSSSDGDESSDDDNDGDRLDHEVKSNGDENKDKEKTLEPNPQDACLDDKAKQRAAIMVKLEDLRSVPVPSEPEPVVSPELSTEERRTKYQKTDGGDQEENGDENGEKKDKTDKPRPGMKSNPKGKKTELFTESEDEAGLRRRNMFIDRTKSTQLPVDVEEVLGAVDEVGVEEEEMELTKEEWDAMAVEEYYNTWYEEMGDDGSNWTDDWSKPPQAFDRYAHLDGKTSMHKLKDADGDDGPKPSKTEKKGKSKDDDNHEGKPTKKEKKACKKKVEAEEEEPAARKKASKKSKKANKVEQDDDEVVKVCRVPKQEREQVAQITAYLRSINYLGETVRKVKDLTEASKTVLRENTPSSEAAFLDELSSQPRESHESLADDPLTVEIKESLKSAALKAAKRVEFVLSVLMLCWTYSVDEEYEVLEFFAGVGNLTKQALVTGYNALRFDILDNQTCALILLVTALGGVWSLEQPDGSTVSRVSWWMAHYKSPTPKRHYAYANSEKILQLDKGPLRAVDRKAKKDRIKTADHYFNKQGKKCYKGTKHLRSTEVYPMPFARTLVDMLDAMKSTAKGQPALPMELPPALTTMGEPWPMADCEWSFAGFGEVFDYLRGNRKLEIPPEYRAVIPRKIG
ncbi:unnamed protein product [Cladocopium goreaui]|uniref:Uncharacterized protein n=1 Tax=Cladocopium goreaui TaxID=2562237 RepID=A0A9P1CTY9_9DINO|nr:unnamed protein product [Cladocopium goreaui]